MTQRFFRSLATIAVFSLFAPFALQAQVTSVQVSNRLTQPINNNVRVTLKGTVHPLANAANDRGPAPAGMPLDHLQIVLKRSPQQEAELKRLIQDQNRPGSPNYHKWLTPEQFGQRFGPSDQDVATLESWLQGQGFNVVKLNPGRQTLVVSGNAAQFQNAFHAQIHAYAVNGQIHYANATNPQIPAALAPVFGGFASLNNFHPRPLTHVMGHATYDPQTGKATPQWTYGDSSGVSFAFTPGDLRVQYDLPAGLDGTGQTIAIINEANINVAQVQQFRTLFGLPNNPVRVIIDGNDPGINGINNPDGPNYASVEAYLDVEWAGAVAPGATIDLVIGGDTALASGLILAAERAVYSDIAPVISISFGLGCEQQLGSANQFVNELWEQAAAQGITVVVASGDSGSAGCDFSGQYAVGGAAVSGLASTPYDVAVGGTDFYYSSYNQGTTAIDNQLATYWNTTPTPNPAVSIKSVIPEQPWNNSQYGLNLLDYYQSQGATTINSASGGASSCVTGTTDPNTGEYSTCTGGYPKPAWQSGAGVPNDSVRDIPDVSLFAANGLNGSFYPVCAEDGDCQPASGGNLIQITGAGGTSASAPAFAGIMALVNQKYGRQGQADAVLYPLAAQYPAAFHDVTHGTNSVPCATGSINCIAVSNPITVNSTTEGQIGSGATPKYNATAGYDLATGLGTVDATQLIDNWPKVTFASTTVSLTSPGAGATFTHGQPITFAGSVTGSGSSTPSGDVVIETDTTTPVNQTQMFYTLANGAFSGSNSALPGGTYNVWAHYGGDTTNAQGESQPVQITISPENSGIAFNAFTSSLNSNGYAAISSSASNTTLPYGSRIVLSGVVAPSADVDAEQKCVTGVSSTCPTFTAGTGTMTFSDNGKALNAAMLNAQGEAAYSAAAFGVGSHSVTAGYSGDASYNASTSSAVNFNITKAQTTVFVTTGLGTVQQGQDLTLTILVEGYGVGVAPTGTVSISGGPTGTPTSATLTPTVDPFYNVSAGTATVTIHTSAPTTSSLVPMERGPLSGWAAGGGMVLACVLFFGIPARRRAWRGLLGLVVITLFTLSVSIGCGGGGSGGSGGGGGGGGGGTVGGTTIGSYNITANYGGDSNYVASSGSSKISVTAASSLLTSTTSVTSTATSPSPTAAVGVNVQVAGVSGRPAPTGTVVLYTGTLSPDTSGQAVSIILAQGNLTPGTGSSSTFSTTFDSENMLQGSNLVTVLYRGDTNYAPSSTTIDLSNPLSDFSMVPLNSIVPLNSTGSASDTLNLASVNGFNGTVALACTPPTGVPTLSCSIAPGSVSLAGGGSSETATLTVTGAAVPAGNYSFLITGTSGSTIHTLAVQAAVR